MQREFILKRLRLFAISPMAVVHKKNFTFRHVKILLLSDLLSLNHIKTWKCIKMFSYQIINYKYLVSDNYLCYKQLQFWIKSKSVRGSKDRQYKVDLKGPEKSLCVGKCCYVVLLARRIQANAGNGLTYRNEEVGRDRRMDAFIAHSD